jgi:peptidoglycan-N-acetylglucosamine deacetylase
MLNQLKKRSITLLIVLSAIAAWPAVAWLQQERTGPDAFPGARLSEDQLRKTAAEVRAGRVLTPKSWPNGAKVAVCLSFDIDNESPMLARDLNPPPTPMSETEYGAKEGLPRILALLDREKLPASFYVPAVSAVVAPDMIPAIMKSGRHEIALHGWIHESLPTLNNGPEEERLLNQAIEYLTKSTGKRPAGTRAGGWALSHFSVDVIKRARLLYDSSMMAMDQPYELMAHGESTGIIELPVSWIEDDAPYFGRTGALPSPELIFSVYRDEFDVAYREGTMLMLTFHPHVSGRRSRLVHLEKLIAYMKAKPGVWFATAEQIANYVKPQTRRTDS